MNILLINDNPVVSRLLVLCTRDEHIVLEELSSIDTMKREQYDVVFIDEGSYEGEILHLSKNLTIGKKILFSNTDVEISDFDMTIKKPFLPSQIIEALEPVEMTDAPLDEEIDSNASIFASTDTENSDLNTDDVSLNVQVLDTGELEKIKSLLEMDDEIEENVDELSEEEIEHRKLEVIKEQLIAEGLEIVGEEDIVDELSAEDEIVIFSNNDKETDKSKKKNKAAKSKNKKSKKKKNIAFTEEELERVEDAVQVAIGTLKRKQIKKLLKGKEVTVNIQLEDND